MKILPQTRWKSDAPKSFLVKRKRERDTSKTLKQEYIHPNTPLHTPTPPTHKQIPQPPYIHQSMNSEKLDETDVL